MIPARAMTILEVLIVVGLLAALTAMTLPAMSRWIAPVTFEETCAQIEHAARLTAESARRAGTPMALVAEPSPDGRTTLVMAKRLEDVADDGDDVELDPSEGVTERARRADGRAPFLPEPFLRLPTGLELAKPGGDREADASFGIAEPGSDSRLDRCVLAIAFPDGTLVPGDAFVLVSSTAEAGPSFSAMGHRLVMTPQEPGTDQSTEEAEPELPLMEDRDVPEVPS